MQCAQKSIAKYVNNKHTAEKIKLKPWNSAAGIDF